MPYVKCYHACMYMYAIFVYIKEKIIKKKELKKDTNRDSPPPCLCI